MRGPLSCTNYAFGNPNVLTDPGNQGELSAVHKWQVKLNGFYVLPLDINFGASFRWLSGAPWGATTDHFAFRV